MFNETPSIATIVVPLDGSNLAELALPIATAIAGPSGARISLTTVALSYQVPVDSQVDVLTRGRLNIAHTELQARFSNVTKTVLAGDPVQEISNHASAIGADLIVMATHGRSGIRKLLLGSVTNSLLSMSRVPTVVVRGAETDQVESIADPATINRIVLPLDGSETGLIAVPYALELARLLEAETVIVHVDEGVNSGRVRDQIEVVKHRFESAGLASRPLLATGNPGQAIAETAAENPFSMVVMSSLSATGIAKGTHRGSVADYVIKHSTAPVLIVPPTGYLGPAVE